MSETISSQSELELRKDSLGRTYWYDTDQKKRLGEQAALLLLGYGQPEAIGGGPEEPAMEKKIQELEDRIGELQRQQENSAKKTEIRLVSLAETLEAVADALETKGINTLDIRKKLEEGGFKNASSGNAVQELQDRRRAEDQAAAAEATERDSVPSALEAKIDNLANSLDAFTKSLDAFTEELKKRDVQTAPTPAPAAPAAETSADRAETVVVAPPPAPAQPPPAAVPPAPEVAAAPEPAAEAEPAITPPNTPNNHKKRQLSRNWFARRWRALQGVPETAAVSYKIPETGREYVMVEGKPKYIDRTRTNRIIGAIGAAAAALALFGIFHNGHELDELEHRPAKPVYIKPVVIKPPVVKPKVTKPPVTTTTEQGTDTTPSTTTPSGTTTESGTTTTENSTTTENGTTTTESGTTTTENGTTTTPSGTTTENGTQTTPDEDDDNTPDTDSDDTNGTTGTPSEDIGEIESDGGMHQEYYNDANGNRGFGVFLARDLELRRSNADKPYYSLFDTRLGQLVVKRVSWDEQGNLSADTRTVIASSPNGYDVDQTTLPFKNGGPRSQHFMTKVEYAEK
jgi:hypothetical protein